MTVNGVRAMEGPVSLLIPSVLSCPRPAILRPLLPLQLLSLHVSRMTPKNLVNLMAVYGVVLMDSVGVYRRMNVIAIEEKEKRKEKNTNHAVNNWF